MKRLFMLLCAACLACAPVIAQDKANAPASAPASGVEDDEVKVESEYDKAKDETTVEFTKLKLAQATSRQVFLSVSATYAGRKPKRQPEDVTFIVSVVSAQGYKYPDMMGMQSVADGKKLPAVLMLNLDKRRLGEDYLETIGTRMKYEILKRLAQAKTVELRLHDLTIQLD